ncbi:MAG: cellulose synthase catalytic subunit [Dermatophilaceae bacterium]
MTVSFVLAALSLARFSSNSIWLMPLRVILGLNIAAVTVSALSGWRRRRVAPDDHSRRVAEFRESAEQPTVDVFLPTCGEDLAVLANTYRFVDALHAHRHVTVHVLDDADREEVAVLAGRHGFDYVVRPDRGRMKKAGNLQHALSVTSGQFILILDADFVPRPDALDHLIPYMDDPGTGIVQSPQYFDALPTMSWLERGAGATQELFYRWVQPSRDASGAAICVGTCALYRRSALEAIGGFAQIEHSEDVHTGIFLLRAGFRTRYVPILVTKGVCPDDLAGFMNQQYRWCNGSITLLRSGEASREPLRIRQRLCFWAGFLYYITTAVNVFVIHLPAVIMAFWFPGDVVASHFIPFLAGMWVYFVLLPAVSRTRWRFEVLRVQMTYSFCHAVAIADKLRHRTAGWVATGSVGKTSTLARRIARVGALSLTVMLAASWASALRADAAYGLHRYWPMLAFLLAYTYLTLPLTLGFYRVLGWLPSRPLGGQMRREAPRRRRISRLEMASSTIVILFVAVLANGTFDSVIPWGTP